MMEELNSGWSDYTFNPWVGCTKVSDGCRDCYAARQQDIRFGRAKWGDGNARSRTSTSYWNKPKLWNRRAFTYENRPFVLCASLGDVFDAEVDNSWREDLFPLIEQTPHLVWLLLTRRIGNVIGMVDRLPKNAALGISASNQEEYDRDGEALRRVAIQLRPLFTFCNFEPLLGPIKLAHSTAPQWIITGGETGPFARWMSPEWTRSLRDQCADMGLVFHFSFSGTALDSGADLLDGQRYQARPDIHECEWLGGHRNWLEKILSDAKDKRKYKSGADK